jgi:ribosomal protein L37AE/L43A
MRVLVACEFSGAVRRAFRALGHDAWSCDPCRQRMAGSTFKAMRSKPSGLAGTW